RGTAPATIKPRSSSAPSSSACGARPPRPSPPACPPSYRTERNATAPSSTTGPGTESRRNACNTDLVAKTATRNLGRISEIAQVAVRHGFGYFFETHRLTDLLPGRSKVVLDGSPSERGQHLREMLDELGPTFVKFGQLLSTRPDIVPPDILTELQALQDDVRPFPYEAV